MLCAIFVDKDAVEQKHVRVLKCFLLCKQRRSSSTWGLQIHPLVVSFSETSNIGSGEHATNQRSPAHKPVEPEAR